MPFVHDVRCKPPLHNGMRFDSCVPWRLLQQRNVRVGEYGRGMRRRHAYQSFSRDLRELFGNRHRRPLHAWVPDLQMRLMFEPERLQRERGMQRRNVLLAGWESW